MGMSCPRCRGPLIRPAYSRVDNATQVCEDCGTREAVVVAASLPLPPLDQPIFNETAEGIVQTIHAARETENPRP